MWRSFSTFLLLLMALNAGAASGFSVQDMAGRQHRLAELLGDMVSALP